MGEEGAQIYGGGRSSDLWGREELRSMGEGEAQIYGEGRSRDCKLIAPGWEMLAPGWRKRWGA
jgi:hypothetical protein